MDCKGATVAETRPAVRICVRGGIEHTNAHETAVRARVDGRTSSHTTGRSRDILVITITTRCDTINSRTDTVTVFPEFHFGGIKTIF